MKMTLRSKLIALILAIAALITIAITAGSYVQMRRQLIDAAISSEVKASASGTSQLIREWIATRKSIVTAGVQGLQSAEDPLPAIVQTAKSGGFEAAYLGTPDKKMIADHDMKLPADYDPTSRPWYKDYREATETMVTAPYLDMSTQKLVISFVSPAKKGSSSPQLLMARMISGMTTLSSVTAL